MVKEFMRVSFKEPNIKVSLRRILRKVKEFILLRMVVDLKGCLKEINLMD